MRQELEGLAEFIDDIARIEEASAANFAATASRLEQQGLEQGAMPFRDASRRHALRAARSRERCAAFIQQHT